MSTCPRCYEDTGCTCEEHDRIKELEANLTKQAEVNCGLFNEVARLREALEMWEDNDDCRFDHHGCCQTHGGDPCRMQSLKQALKEQS